MSLLEPMIAAIAAGICVPLLLALLFAQAAKAAGAGEHDGVLGSGGGREDVQADVPLKWLRVSLLLILHSLIVGLLCLALGTAGFAGRGGGGDASMGGARCSASMQAKDGNGMRFDDAKRELKAEAKRLTGAGATVGLITFAAPGSSSCNADHASECAGRCD